MTQEERLTFTFIRHSSQLLLELWAQGAGTDTDTGHVSGQVVVCAVLFYVLMELHCGQKKDKEFLSVLWNFFCLSKDILYDDDKA